MAIGNRLSVGRLHVITHPQLFLALHVAVTEMLDAGARWIQLRHKGCALDDLMAEAGRVKDLCDSFDATLIINDNVEVAKKVGAHGVHLGKDDMPPAQARALLGDCIIGGTAHNLDEALSLIEAPVDYIGLGPFRITSTKTDLAPVLGLSGIAPIIERCVDEKMPVIVIGGVVAEDIPAILKLGAHGVAVSQAIYGAPSIGQGLRQLMHATGCITDRGI